MLRSELYASEGDKVFFFKETSDRLISIESCEVIAKIFYKDKVYKIFDFDLWTGLQNIIDDDTQYFTFKEDAEGAAIEYLKNRYLIN